MVRYDGEEGEKRRVGEEATMQGKKWAGWNYSEGEELAF